MAAIDTKAWEPILEAVLERVCPAEDEGSLRWAVIGSVATALQGCRVEPRDIDFLARQPDEVFRFAACMAVYAPPVCPLPPGDPMWVASAERSVDVSTDAYGFRWHFARWIVDGVKVEVAHISPPPRFRTSADGAGIWEGGAEIWPHVVWTPFEGRTIPVVPLEIQLATNLSRGLENRVSEIVAVFRRRGYDRGLLDRALRVETRARVDALLAEPPLTGPRG